MPAMPRVSKKADKIAFKILGTPSNMEKDKSAKDNVEKRLIFEETTRVR
jgi:hypothetical protein